MIDQLRIRFLEQPFFKWYDKHLDSKINDYKDRILWQISK